jgi:peptide deformylase
MKILPILKYPNKILRERAKKIKDPLDPEIQKLILEMTASMRSANGLGLAAPQVGKSLRLCIIEEKNGPQENGGRLFILINPVIKAASKKKVLIEEGCLSFPGKFFPIMRPEKIKVRFLDENGKSCKIKADGLLARAIQHEIDHLDGVLIIDKPQGKLKKRYG